MIGTYPATLFQHDADTQQETQTMNTAKYTQMLKELASDLTDLVRTGDITDVEANQWMVDKQEQWMGGDDV